MYSKLNLNKRGHDALDGMDVYANIFQTNISSKRFRKDIDDAMRRYMPISHDNPCLQYAHYGKELFSAKPPSIVVLPQLELPAFGTDPVEEVQAKFDLVASTLTPLYTNTSPSIKPNTLLFHFTGLRREPYAEGECCPTSYATKECLLSGDKGEKEKTLKLLQNVDESFSFGMNHTSIDPLATILPYHLLKNHIKTANDILKSQYACTMRDKTLTELRDAVVSHHGSDSIVSLLLYMDSTEKMFDSFVPRGICSSISTGKTAAYSDKASYRGVVTIQKSGTLNVDTEDGDSHLPEGSQLNVANLYLIIEMKELVPNDCKFNYPAIGLKLTSQSLDQLEEEKIRHTDGRCHLSRDGKLSKTIILPIATLRVGPYIVHSVSFLDSKQMHEFDVIMGLKCAIPRYIVYQKSFG